MPTALGSERHVSGVSVPRREGQLDMAHAGARASDVHVPPHQPQHERLHARVGPLARGGSHHARGFNGDAREAEGGRLLGPANPVALGRAGAGASADDRERTRRDQHHDRDPRPRHERTVAPGAARPSPRSSCHAVQTQDPRASRDDRRRARWTSPCGTGGIRSEDPPPAAEGQTTRPPPGARGPCLARPEYARRDSNPRPMASKATALSS